MPAVSGVRVLLVDDDPAARLDLTRLLESLGCDVLGVGTAREALRVVDAGTPVDALVIEVACARAGARNVAREVARRWPGARLVFTARVRPDLLPDAVHAAVLVKPVAAGDLARALGRQPR